MRRWILLAVVCLLSVGLWWLLSSDEPAGAGLETSGSPRSTSSEGPGLALTAAGRPTQGGRSSLAEGLPKGEVPDPEPENGERVIQGTLTLVDADCEVVPVPGGGLKLSWWLGEGDPTETDIGVLSGRWTVTLPRRATLRPVSFRSAHGLARIPPEDLLVASIGDEEIAYRAQLPTPAVLHVLDEETRTHLPGVVFVEDGGWFDREYPTYAGFAVDDEREGVLLRNVASPATFPTSAYGGYIEGYLGAPGHVWRSVKLDTAAGGTRTFLLPTAGRLKVTFSGAVPGRDLHVRVREASEDEMGAYVCERELLSLKPHLFEGLAAGLYRVSLERGLSYEGPRVFAGTGVEIEAGGQARAHLTVPTPTTIVAARLPWAGELHVPAEWGLTTVLASLEFLGDKQGEVIPEVRLRGPSGRGMAPAVDNPEVYPFDAGLCVPGRYLLELPKIGYAGVVELPPGGDREARLLIGAPAHVTVKVVNVRTGTDAPVAGVSWCLKRTPGVRSRRLQRVARDPKSGHYKFLAPSGRLELNLAGDAYYTPQRSVDVVAGRQTTVTLEAELTSSVELVFMEGDARVPCEWGWEHTATELGGSGSVFQWSEDDGVFHMFVTRRGRYTVHVDDIPGYEPLPDQEVDLTSAGPNRVTFQLVRKP